MECVFGANHQAAVARFAEGTRARTALERRYAAPTLWDAFLHYLAREGYAIGSAHLHREVTGPLAPEPDVQAILVTVYRTDPKNAELCERLVDLDEGFQGGGYRHLKMGESTIGSQGGSGGRPRG